MSSLEILEKTVATYAWILLRTCLEAKDKIVTCLDIMRDKEGINEFISALILLQVDGQPETYRRVGFSTMTKGFFQDAELTSVTIV
jgi:hypothetical protein